MPLVTTTEMFKKAYEGGYAIGAFNVNNMEIIQGITEAAKEENAPLILQVSKGARNYAKPVYLTKLVEGRVWNCTVPAGAVPEYESRLQIVSLRNESESSVSIRYLAELPCCAGSAAASPRLEDLYLWLFPQSGAENGRGH